MSILDKITMIEFPASQYLDKEFKKIQCVVHHTASGNSPYGVIDYWKGNSDRVGTPFLITRDTTSHFSCGSIVQLFGSNRGIWHLGVSSKDLIAGGKTSLELNMQSIGIELLNYGYLIERNGKFITYDGTIIPDADIVDLGTPFRGYRYYHKYLDCQLETARELLLYLCDRYDIDKSFKGEEIFNVDKRALKGESGIFTHVSYRKSPEKFDCFPQRELIQMLSSL
jgi:N-acetyl-anhydromuramyl-L-alanine amidase AmpD